MPQEIQNAKLSTVAEFALLARKNPSTIYTDLATGRVPLPPVFRFTPTSRPFFVNAQEWLDSQIQTSLAATQTAPRPILQAAALSGKKRGRPSNLARRAAKIGGA